VPDGQQIALDPEADRRIRPGPLLRRHLIRGWSEEPVASCSHTNVPQADVDRSARMHRQYRYE
jgi:hypothetical protein